MIFKSEEGRLEEGTRTVPSGRIAKGEKKKERKD